MVVVPGVACAPELGVTVVAPAVPVVPVVPVDPVVPVVPVWAAADPGVPALPLEPAAPAPAPALAWAIRTSEPEFNLEVGPLLGAAAFLQWSATLVTALT